MCIYIYTHVYFPRIVCGEPRGAAEGGGGGPSPRPRSAHAGRTTGVRADPTEPVPILRGRPSPTSAGQRATPQGRSPFLLRERPPQRALDAFVLVLGGGLFHPDGEAFVSQRGLRGRCCLRMSCSHSFLDTSGLTLPAHRGKSPQLSPLSS